MMSGQHGGNTGLDPDRKRQCYEKEYVSVIVKLDGFFQVRRNVILNGRDLTGVFRRRESQ